MSCAKTQIKYLNPGMFLLCIYRYILLCFYCVDTETYCGSSEFKYLGTVAKNVCSIMLEICPTPNPTLNLPDSVNKCKTDIKTCLLMQPCHFNFLICRFELFCRTVITQDSNLSSSPSKYISVLRELPNKLDINENVSGYSRNPCSLNRERGAALSLHALGTPLGVPIVWNPYRIMPIHWLMAWMPPSTFSRRILYWRMRHLLLRFLCRNGPCRKREELGSKCSVSFLYSENKSYASNPRISSIGSLDTIIFGTIIPNMPS